MAMLLLLAGCESGAGIDDEMDAGSVADAGQGRADAGRRDAGARVDGGVDAGPEDAGGALDAGLFDAGVPDAGESDGEAADAGALDAAMDGGAGPITFACALPVLPNDANPGMVLSSAFWPGFRFEVPAGGDVEATSIGLTVESSGGTVFAAIVRLSGASDAPDAADLTGADVVATSLITLPDASGSVTVTAPIAATLAPGWYAAVYGTGAHGAAIDSASVHSNSGAGGCGSGFGYPFTIRQSDGALLSQAATPHFVVEGTPL